MKVGNDSYVAVEGEVEVFVYGRRRTSARVYEATGTSTKGDLEEAVDRMRLNASYKYRAEFNLASNEELQTNIREYKVVDRGVPTTTKRKIVDGEVVYAKEVKYKKSRFKRKNKNYYAFRDAKTGRFVSGGRFEVTDYDVDGYIEKGNTFDQL